MGQVIQEKNVRLINERLEAGLALLRKYYDVREQAVDEVLANPVIGGRPHHARRFDIKGVGNLLVMTVTEAEENQLSSFVIMPYFKNLPLFSTDYVYSGERRFFLLEIYDLSVDHDDVFEAGIERFRAFGDEMTDMPDIPTRPAWYDDIRPVCHAKAPDDTQDELAIRRFLAFLQLFVDMEQTSQTLGDDDLKLKWQKNRDYADRLIDEGGVSTDLFTAALGAENTRRFFHEVFFGADCYRPSGETLDLQGVERFLEHVDTEGKSNREKIIANQHVIRRIATTDKSKSYEDPDNSGKETEKGDKTSVNSDGIVDLPAGVVIEDGRLIGFGIHIFNEDIYPLQSFEIYLRNCGLSGPLDLSGQKDLLFVDIYHNKVDAIDVSGCSSLRILGIQDNEIAALDVADLEACQGIDGGMNRISSLDVSRNRELVELYINDNEFTEIDISACPKLKYFYCHNNAITELDTTANPLLRHLNATGNPMRSIKALAPQREERLPLELKVAGSNGLAAGGFVGLKFNPVYNAQWKETGEWQQSYYAYPAEGYEFEGWHDEAGAKVSGETEWFDEYGTSRVLTARFSEI